MNKIRSDQAYTGIKERMEKMYQEVLAGKRERRSFECVCNIAITCFLENYFTELDARMLEGLIELQTEYNTNLDKRLVN